MTERRHKKRVAWIKFIIIIIIICVGRQTQPEQRKTSHLQQHFAAVDAHGIHGAEGHESDGDRRRRVHRVIVTEHTRGKRNQYKLYVFLDILKEL